ncbi:MAG: hypothetical protein QOI16_3870, partial [Pseudonocardiales bacterium]|nr:hypothetical protein [Pseudonocardiales bacterium]
SLLATDLMASNSETSEASTMVSNTRSRNKVTTSPGQNGDFQMAVDIPA